MTVHSLIPAHFRFSVEVIRATIDAGQAAPLQKGQQRLIEEAAVSPHRAQPHPLGQERQRLLKKRHRAARRAGVPTAQPAAEDEGRLRQHRQQRMMAVAPLALGIATLERALLFALATEHRRIQIEREAGLGAGHQPQEPAPERTPERLEVGLGKAEEEVADRVITGEARQPQHGVEHAVSAQPAAVGEALRAGHRGHEEGGETVSQRDGVVGSGFGERHPPLHLGSETDLAQEGDETGQAAEGGDGLGCFLQNELGVAEEGGDFRAGRFVRGGIWFE